jgi:general nucleoside transport system ATP-binding protein
LNDGAAPPVIEARSISKRYGSLVALDGVNFGLRAGEVHALVGENGAGKSTLMNVLYGMQLPDGGTVVVNGNAVRFSRCTDAMRAGVGMVFQHFLLVDRFTVAENVLLGREPTRRGLIDRQASNDELLGVAKRYGFRLDPASRVEDLGVGARQQVELLKVLEREAKVIILDEPTASLSPTEALSLIEIVRKLRAEGRAIAFVSHKLREVLDIADRITILRAGKVVGSVRAADADVSSLAELMVGRRVDLDSRVERSTAPKGPTLVVDDLTVRRDNGAVAVEHLRLTARAGEIVGIAGVEGNGQLEFAESVYGLRPVAGGHMALNDRDVTREPTIVRRALGMRYIPADRQREGLVLEFDTAENMLLGDQRRQGGMLLDEPAARARADEVEKEFAVPAHDAKTPVDSFSGGTQQKLIAGRELAPGASLVIAFTPTRGVDVGAAETIHARLRRSRDEGSAVLLISYDLDEIRALSDRIVVFSSGSIAGELSPADATDLAIGRLMGGVDAVA